MSTTYRDQRIADDVGADPVLMCSAVGCPHRWSVDAGNGRLCSAHAWIPFSQWASVTRRLVDAETERAYRQGTDDEHRPRRPIDKRAVIDRLRSLSFGQQGGRDWAERLRQREEAGEPADAGTEGGVARGPACGRQ